jgi:hypothetical protein
MGGYLGGWSRNTTGQLRNKKLQLSSVIDDTEAITEEKPLTTHEIELN